MCQTTYRTVHPRVKETPVRRGKELVLWGNCQGWDFNSSPLLQDFCSLVYSALSTPQGRTYLCRSLVFLFVLFMSVEEDMAYMGHFQQEDFFLSVCSRHQAIPPPPQIMVQFHHDDGLFYRKECIIDLSEP